MLEFLQEGLLKLLIGTKFGNLLIGLDSLSSKSFVGKKSAYSWSLVIFLSINLLSDSLNDSLLDINITNSDLLGILLLEVV